MRKINKVKKDTSIEKSIESDKEVEVILTKDQFIGFDEVKKGDTVKVSPSTASRMKERGLIK